MPTYTYACKSCDHQFDIRQSFSEDPLTVCPECGQALRKVIHPVGISFKGSGFYKTDSRSSSKPAGTGAAGASGSSDSSSSSGSSSNGSNAGSQSSENSSTSSPGSGSSSSGSSAKSSGSSAASGGSSSKTS